MDTINEAYELLYSVIENVPYGIMSINKTGEVLMTNEEALISLGIEESVDTVLNAELNLFIDDFHELKLLLDNFQKEGQVQLKEIYHKEKYLNISIKPSRNGLLLSINDITKQKLAKSEAMRALMEGQEMERLRLAKEIHDGIGPLMSTLKLHLDAIIEELANAPAKTKRKVDLMNELIQNVSTDIRSISHDLMPGALVDFGLIKALKNLCQRVNDSEKLEVSFYQKGIDKRLDQDQELNLYRIAQELLNNSLKYAKAKNIQIQIIRRRKGKIILTVEDDGIGCDLKNISSNGIGLMNIRTRVQSLGGLFFIESQIGKGLLATIEIPSVIKSK